MTDRPNWADKPVWEEGRIYTEAELAPWVWTQGYRRHSQPYIPADTRFICSRDELGRFVFDEIVESADPLIPSTEAQAHVEDMREHGLSFREIARLAGCSIETVYRASNGVGRVRQSTQDALETVHAGMNGRSCAEG